MVMRLEILRIYAILTLLLTLLPLLSSGEPQEAVVLEEMKVAREAAERRAIQLEAEVSRLKKDLDRIRSSYANLYLESHSSIERLRRMELRAAQMLRQKEGGELEKVSEEALEALEQAGRRQLAVERSLSEFEQALATMLDVLRPSDAMRHELSSRLQALRGAVEESLKPMSIVAGRDVVFVAGRDCGIVAVNEELDVVLLDRGSRSGMRPGAKYCLKRGETTVARFLVIDVRGELSAAVLVEGALGEVAVGSIVQPEEQVSPSK